MNLIDYLNQLRLIFKSPTQWLDRKYENYNCILEVSDHPEVIIMRFTCFRPPLVSTHTLKTKINNLGGDCLTFYC